MSKRWGRTRGNQGRPASSEPTEKGGAARPAAPPRSQSTSDALSPESVPDAFLFEIRAQAFLAHKAFQELERDLRESRSVRRSVTEAVDAASMSGPGAATGTLLDSLQAEGNRVVRQLGLVQTVLTSAGVVSSIFWPSMSRAGGATVADLERRQARGKSLRDLFEVTEASPLASREVRERDARGGLLHFDELLDQFAAAHPGQKVRAWDVGVLEAADDWDPAVALRSLDEETMVIRVQGRPPRSCDLRALDIELVRIGGRIQIKAEVSPVRRPGKSEGDSGASFHMVT